MAPKCVDTDPPQGGVHKRVARCATVSVVPGALGQPPLLYLRHLELSCFACFLSELTRRLGSCSRGIDRRGLSPVRYPPCAPPLPPRPLPLSTSSSGSSVPLSPRQHLGGQDIVLFASLMCEKWYISLPMVVLTFVSPITRKLGDLFMFTGHASLLFSLHCPVSSRVAFFLLIAITLHLFFLLTFHLLCMP